MRGGIISTRYLRDGVAMKRSGIRCHNTFVSIFLLRQLRTDKLVPSEL